MSDDLRIRVDKFFASSKTLEGAWQWYESERSGTMKFRRQIAEDGVVLGFRIEANAHIGTVLREFRFMVVGLDECLFRLDCAPTMDGAHINGPKRPMGFPFAVEGFHYHPWVENRAFSTPSKIYGRLPYALEIPTGISNIQQGFRVFCDLVGITASSADNPDWPKTRTLL